MSTSFHEQVLRKLHEKGAPQVVGLVENGYGVHEGRAFFAMELLGMNLAQMQRSTPGNRWGLEDVCLIGALTDFPPPPLPLPLSARPLGCHPYSSLITTK